MRGNPAFVNAGAAGAVDYHLAAASAAIDAGVDSGVSTDLDGEARPRWGAFDIGADEYYGAPPYTTADVQIIQASSWITGSATVTYTITFTNAGPEAAYEVTVTDTLADNLIYQGQASLSMPMVGPTRTAQVITWVTPTLAANASGVIVYTATIAPGADGWLTNTVSITSTSTDASPSNNESATYIYAELGEPTAIALMYFDITAVQGRSVTLAWATGITATCNSFNLYRASGEQGQDAVLVHNERVHLPRGIFAAYTYTDLVPAPGTWWYWLTCVEPNGIESTAILSSTAAVTSFFYQLYIPVALSF